MAQIPRGHENLVCPLHQKSMDEVCHKCPLWIQIRGADPQTGEPLSDEWECSLSWLPTLLINAAQQARQTGASTDKVATEVAKVTTAVERFHEGMVQANTFLERNMKLIENS